MATIDTLKFSKIIVRVGLLLVQVLGVWPYRYDPKSRRFHSATIIRCYTAVIGPSILFAYIFILKTMKINADPRVHVPSSTGRFTTIFYHVIVTIVYVIASVYLPMNYNRISKWFNEARIVMERIHSFKNGNEQQPFLRPILHFVGNVLLINGLLLYASIGILSNLISDRTSGKYLYIALYLLPNAFITIIRDIFYGLMLTTTYNYRYLNHQLKNIMKEVFNNQDGSSHLSDDIDQLAILHGAMTMCTIRMNQLFSVPLICSIAYTTFIFVSKMFIVYIAIEYGSRHTLTVGFNFSILWYNIVVLAMSFWTLCVLSHSCHVTVAESEKTANILLPSSLNKSLDTRLRRSLDAFSLQLSNSKLTFSICGLFLMDHTILHSIIASAVSYTFILIQFELEEK